MDQNRFFREMARLGTKHGMDTALHEAKLHVSRDGKPLCQINGKGGVLVHSTIGEMMDFYTDAMDAREYVTAVEQAPPLVADGLGSGYVKLAEFEDTVLAGKDMGEHGYQFITWQWTYGRTSLRQGHYYDNVAAAKEDFAFRSGLAPEHRRFSPEQAKALHDTVSMVLDRHLTQSWDEREHLQQCQEKLELAYPELAEQITVLVVERDKPTEVRSIRNSSYAIEDIIGGSLDSPGWEGGIRHYFNGDIDPCIYDDSQVSRILPDGAVLGTLVITGWDEQKRAPRSLTVGEIESERAIMDAPEHQPDRDLNIGPTMGM